MHVHDRSLSWGRAAKPLLVHFVLNSCRLEAMAMKNLADIRKKTGEGVSHIRGYTVCNQQSCATTGTRRTSEEWIMAQCAS